MKSVNFKFNKGIKSRKIGKVFIGFILLLSALRFAPDSKQSGVVTPVKPTPTSVTTVSVTPNSTKVIKVIDGDTITVDINGKVEAVRLIGVDTPETVDPRKPVQCFGKEASNKAKELMTDKSVILDSDPTQADKDKYGRLLRYVHLENGTFINQRLIEEGYGFEYTYNIPYKYQVEFKQAQQQAEENKLGLWADNACPTSTPLP